MTIDFRNTNTIWSSILVETLNHLGLTTAIVCPGSRSTPLTFAFAQHPTIEAIPILDERSAAFFALGIAKRSGTPCALICTSGTAGANFYPAVIEAKESHVPLLIFTADRPPELRNCHAGQTIDQVKLYGNYPNWQAELAVPSQEMGMLCYLRQNIIHAWERSLFPFPGVVHINLPFRDPLSPQTQPDPISSQFNHEAFFAGISTLPLSGVNTPPNPPLSRGGVQYFSPPYQVGYLTQILQEQTGIIIAGVSQSQNPKEYCQAIARLSQFLGFPVLGEALSPIRNHAHLNPYLITTYDLILRNQKLAEKLAPKIVIQIGELPTSKELRTWLEITQPQRLLIDSTPENLDPLHGKTIHLRLSIEEFTNRFISNNLQQPTSFSFKLWGEVESKIRAKINQTMNTIDKLIEPKTAWLLAQNLPEKTPIFIANSMSVRNVEFFWTANNRFISPYFNRGANGIDGTLSTALGIAHRHQSSVMLTGDLALLHDTNGFLISQKFVGHLTIILINNNGGGIFEMLPIAQFDPPFEEYFATPQNINFAQLCATYGVEHELINNWEQLKQLLNPLPKTGIRVLEIRTNRKTDALWLQENLPKFAADLN